MNFNIKYKCKRYKENPCTLKLKSPTIPPAKCPFNIGISPKWEVKEEKVK